MAESVDRVRNRYSLAEAPLLRMVPILTSASTVITCDKREAFAQGSEATRPRPVTPDGAKRRSNPRSSFRTERSGDPESRNCCARFRSFRPSRNEGEIASFASAPLRGRFALSRAITSSRHKSAVSRRDASEWLMRRSPREGEGASCDPQERARRDPQREGAGNAGCPLHPQPRAQR